MRSLTQIIFQRNTLLLAALFLAWQLPGIIGREPWKSDEAYTMGLVHHMMESGDLVIPSLGGEPFMQKPPVFFVTATALAKVCAPFLAPHEGARLAALLFNLLTLIFVSLASRELNGPGRGWPAAVMFLACIGPLHMAHFVLTDLALLTGVALSLYGIALGMRRTWAGGIVCGTGAGLAFMAKGLVGPGILGVAVLALPVFDLTWRNKNWFRFVSALLVASLPWVIVWPLAVYLQSPELFSEWIIDNNFGRFIHVAGHDVNGPKAVRGYMFVLLPWYAFPASLFAAWSLWREGRGFWKSAALRTPLILLGAGLFVFTASRDGREIYALPLVVPLLVIGARKLGDIPPRMTNALNLGIIGLFSLLAVVAWLAWGAMMADWPSSLISFMQARAPGFVAEFRGWNFISALLLTLAWVVVVLTCRNEPLRLPAHFAAGIALAYGLAMTLFLPLAESRMSYRTQFEPLREILPPHDVIVTSRGLGEPQRAMLDYYAGLQTLRLEKKVNRKVESSWFVTQTTIGVDEDKHNPGAGWERVWQDTHENERFQLFRRVKP